MFIEEIKAQYEVAFETKERITFETLVTAFAAVLMTVLVLISLPTTALSICSIVLSGVVYFFCRREFNDAIISLFQKQPSNDTFNVAALLINVIHSFALIFAHSVNASFFAPAIFFSVTASMGMKLIFVNEILKNLELAANNSVYIVEVGRASLAKRYIEKVCTVNPIVRFPDMVGITYSEDPSEDKNRSFVPIILLSALVASFIPLFFHGVNMLFTAMGALFAVAAAFTGEMTFVLPYLVVQYKLRRLGSLLFGYHSLTELKNIDTIMVKDTEMFPEEGIWIDKLKLTSLPNAAQAVEFTASILNEVNAPESKAFMGFIGFDKKYLPTPDSIRVLNGYGFVAQFGEKLVLLGNRGLLLSYNVIPYPQEKEATFATGGSLMYCAVDGELAASYLVTYECDPSMKKSAENIAGEFNIIVDTDDCNITEPMVRKHYDMQNATVIVPDESEMQSIKRMQERMENSDSPCMLSSKRAIGILESVRHAKNLSFIIDYSILTYQIGIILGMVFTLAALILAPAMVNSLWVFLYNLLWTLPIIILSLVKSGTAK